MKTSKNYHQLPTQTVQQVLKILDRSWTAFFCAIKAWNNDKSKFKGRPKPSREKPTNGGIYTGFYQPTGETKRLYPIISQESRV